MTDLEPGEARHVVLQAYRCRCSTCGLVWLTKGQEGSDLPLLPGACPYGCRAWRGERPRGRPRGSKGGPRIARKEG